MNENEIIESLANVLDAVEHASEVLYELKDEDRQIKCWYDQVEALYLEILERVEK
jgi:hypothetical protein